MTPADLLWKPMDKDNFSDPYPMYSLLRENDPVHLSQTGEWIITRYEDVKRILKDPRFVVGNRFDWIKRGIDYMKNDDLDFQAIATAMNSFLLFLNPPQHTKIRKFVSTQWNDREVSQMVDQSIVQLMNDIKKDQFDLVQDFAQRLPALTMCKILGIPSEDYYVLKGHARELIKAFDLYISAKDLVTIHNAAHAFVNYFRSIISNKSFSNKGLLAKIYKANTSSSDPLSEQELISICIFLFTAGEETTSSLVGTGVLNLLRNKKETALRENLMDWDLAIDELLRYDPPVQLLGRIATEDIHIENKLIIEGSTVTLSLGAANRDPNVFPNPDKLDLSRQQNRHIAFGSGIHFCLGDWLGKLQGKMAIQKIFEAYPDIRLASTSLQWNRNIAIRSLSSLGVIKH